MAQAASESDVWPEEMNVPTADEPPVEIDLTDPQVQERLSKMLDLAESGEAAGLHTDPELFAAWQDAESRRRDGPLADPRTEFNKLRDRMDLPGMGGAHSPRAVPDQGSSRRGTDPGNLYATQEGSDAHKEFHRIFGAEGKPYRGWNRDSTNPGCRISSTSPTPRRAHQLRLTTPRRALPPANPTKKPRTIPTPNNKGV